MMAAIWAWLATIFDRLTVGIGWSGVMPFAAAIVVTFTVLSVLAMRRRLAGLESRLAVVEQLAEQLRAALRQQEAAGRTLAAGLERSNERVGQVELRAGSRPYEQAIRMAAQGGSTDGLMRYFGLTDGEAALVRLLHGNSQRENSTESARTVQKAGSAAPCG